MAACFLGLALNSHFFFNVLFEQVFLNGYSQMVIGHTSMAKSLFLTSVWSYGVEQKNWFLGQVERM